MGAHNCCRNINHYNRRRKGEWGEQASKQKEDEDEDGERGQLGRNAGWLGTTDLRGAHIGQLVPAVLKEQLISLER